LRPTPDTAYRGALGRLASLKIKRNALIVKSAGLEVAWRRRHQQEDFGDPSSADD
jgi:hypothetical protein